MKRSNPVSLILLILISVITGTILGKAFSSLYFNPIDKFNSINSLRKVFLWYYTIKLQKIKEVLR
jgi:hypothetical protein